MRFFILSISFLVAVTVSTPSQAYQCWCVFLNGYRECFDVNGSECARIDRQLTNATCQWSLAGSCTKAKMKKENQRHQCPIFWR